MTMSEPVVYSDHARQRQAQRNLSDEDIDFVLQYGERVYRAGVAHVFLGKRHIPADRAIRQRFARLEGTVLLLAAHNGVEVIITAYRNRSGMKAIRRKTKYDCRTSFEGE